MPVVTLYDTCLRNVLKSSCLNRNNLKQLPISCLRDILPYLSPYELERFDFIYRIRHIQTNDLWRRHFELIWSISRDDKDSYESIFDIPYKRLYFEYLFHDTQILQLGIYIHISQINISKSIVNLSFIEHIKYNLTRDSIIYCSKRRLSDDNQSLAIIWNHQWNKYIKRFILVPNVWNLTKIDPLLMECFTENVTDIVLSGYPTESDYHGMKFILDILTRGHITNIVLKFPSYCLLNILSPLLIYPRSYSLSYLSTSNENDNKPSNLFTQNFILPHRQRQQCLQVEIHSLQENSTNLHRFESNDDHLIEYEDSNSTDTTHAVISESIRSSHDSLDVLSTLAIENHFSQSTLQQHLPSDDPIQADMPIIESSHLTSLSDHSRPTIEPYERLLPYLNRSRNLQQYSNRRSILTPIRHISTSEQSVTRIQPVTNLIAEPISSSDSNLFRQQTTTIVVPASETSNSTRKQQVIEDSKEKYLLVHLTPQYQTNSLTNLSIYYVSSFETIEMIAVALLGMNQIHHLTLVNFAIYSSQLETTLFTLCNRSQLQSLNLTSISLIHGSIGFLLHLFQTKINHKNININLKHLRLDTIKMFSLLTNGIHLSDVEQAEFIQNSSLEQFIWRERHMQYIHIRLLYKLSRNIMSKLHRLELSSILECTIFDQYTRCQTFLHHISDVRLRNIRIRPIHLKQFFSSLNTPAVLTVFHFERIGLTWNNNQQSIVIQDAFTYLMLYAKHLVELSLAYNNLNNNFIQWLCQMLLSPDKTIEMNNTSWWPVGILNLTFNLITSESIRRLIDTLKEYKIRWKIGYSPIRRIYILGNALEMREIPNLKKQFNALGCDLISYIFCLDLFALIISFNG
ncbi:unnamed protein product [Rotaria socialis]|uniref:F-box domain-containing protein n=1 Tax=Rotaria socialis TaxID=392032 RepID=A0A820QJM4_9BILA|nr:unnamed protein product [Rotaria socialis]CAF4423771.1 unnamed protein product [Rotaria socialis]